VPFVSVAANLMASWTTTTRLWAGTFQVWDVVVVSVREIEWVTVELWLNSAVNVALTGP